MKKYTVIYSLPVGYGGQRIVLKDYVKCPERLLDDTEKFADYIEDNYNVSMNNIHFILEGWAKDA